MLGRGFTQGLYLGGFTRGLCLAGLCLVGALHILVFAEAAALEECSGGEDEEEGAGGLHEGYCVEGGRETDILRNHAA